jgi:hypothetical protein
VICGCDRSRTKNVQSGQYFVTHDMQMQQANIASEARTTWLQTAIIIAFQSEPCDYNEKAKLK